jgi:hypothetical protein
MIGMESSGLPLGIGKADALQIGLIYRLYGDYW